MPDYEMYFDEKNQNNYLKHIDYNTKNIKNIDLLNFDCVNMLCNQISFLNYLKLLSI